MESVNPFYPWALHQKVFEGKCSSYRDETRNKLDEDTIVNQDNISNFKITESTWTTTLLDTANRRRIVLQVYQEPVA